MIVVGDIVRWADQFGRRRLGRVVADAELRGAPSRNVIDGTHRVGRSELKVVRPRHESLRMQR